MNKIIILLLITFLFSCFPKQNPFVTVINKSIHNFDSIKIYTVFSEEKTTFKEIKPNETERGIIKFKNTPKSDGSYTIELYIKNKLLKQKSFGYYTNGGSLDNAFKITIENDTILIE